MRESIATWALLVLGLTILKPGADFLGIIIGLNIILFASTIGRKLR